MTTEHITIAGAGLAGALLGVFLARRGHEVELFERRPDMRQHNISAGRSINLALADRGIHALQAAGVFDAIEPLMIPMPGRMLHDLSGNLSFQKYGRRDDEINYSISRGELNKVLMTAAEETGRVNIRFNTRCDDYDIKSGLLTMTDESSQEQIKVKTSVVFGCDGASSPIRNALVRQCKFVVSEEPLAHAYKELAIPPGKSGEWRIEKNALHIWPRGGFMLIALPNLDGSFTVTLFLPVTGNPSFNSLESESEVEKFFSEQFPDALAQITDLAKDFFSNPMGMLGTIRCNQWQADGRAALLGDAAHAVVPFHGQGMNCAFEDCLELDRLIEQHGKDWVRILPDFEKARVANANAIADMALENYIEMRDIVRDPRFQLQKQLEFLLEEKFPERFIPRYSMVMFHQEIPYTEAKNRGKIQKAILQQLTESATTLDKIDLTLAERLVNEKLDLLR